MGLSKMQSHFSPRFMPVITLSIAIVPKQSLRQTAAGMLTRDTRSD